jgi:FdhD protein
MVEKGQARSRLDYLAAEEPMEIRLIAGEEQKTVAVTMRTPGADFELAAGFLYSESVILDRSLIRRIAYCVDPHVDAEQRYNIVSIWLHAPSLPELVTLERHFHMSSACGVCGKASLEAITNRGCAVLPPGPTVSATLIGELPERLRARQQLFTMTGGLHAAALFNQDGELLCIREDMGRHNAVDKVVGWALLNNHLPLHNCILLVSGRASYEILQKAVLAGVPIVCAVSAPSHLAVAVAEQFDATLIGFLRDQRFNIYAGEERILFGTEG